MRLPITVVNARLLEGAGSLGFDPTEIVVLSGERDLRLRWKAAYSAHRTRSPHGEPP